MPTLRGRDIVCISSIDWDFIWQGHQQIMSSLVSEGNRVLFIENTGVRPPRFGDFDRVRQRIARWWRSTKGFRQETENLYVFSPLIIPLPYSRLARWTNRFMLLRSLRRWMRVMRFKRPIAWTFLPTPLARDLLIGLDPEITVYYCIDDFASSSPAARKIEVTERKVFAEADLVFVTSEKLRIRAAAFNKNVHLFPFAVDYPKFESVREGGVEAPEDLAAVPRPVVGYLGGIHQWVDQALLVDVARRMPDVTFALVGPIQTDVSALAACPNVRLLGARSHTDVPRYLKGFDVGIVPYRLADYTAHVYPTKLNEYLAMGLGVVATDLPEIRRFNGENGNIVTVAKNAEEFATGIRAALEKAPSAEVARRLAVAQENSWNVRIARMSALIEERMQLRVGAQRGWEQRLRQMYRRTRVRVGRTVAAALLVYVTLFWTPLPWMAAEPLRVAAHPIRAAAIVVLAGGVGESGRGGQGYQDRVKTAVKLYQAGLADQMVFSTGWSYTFSEADLMRALALVLGVPSGAIVLENKAGSTHENALFVTAILRERGWTKVLLVTSPYHMRRATLTFKKLAPGIQVVPIPAESSFFVHNDATNVAQLRAIVHEYAAIAAYWWQGWL